MSSEAIDNNMIVCDNVVKIYKTKDIEVVALQGLDLTVARGEMMAIIGNSGSGKSTLLNLLGGLDMPSAGKVTVNGMELAKLAPAAIRRFKSATVGFVWQTTARNLIPYLSALENVILPMGILGKVDRDYANSLLEYVGLGNKLKRRLYELSGGEQQRVAIAIALANKPPLLLADEPTGAVDTKTTIDLLNLFKKISLELGTTIVIVTHDRQVSSFVDRVAAMSDGRASHEFIRRRYNLELESLSAAFHEQTHEEYAVLDRFGRLQLPHNFTRGMVSGSKVKLSVDKGTVIITPMDDNKQV
ncbi:MAG: ABC transporter ATP-binding protein [Defluviitaleaceae bacterium]|nr:ABC transporter ATP-binding protein [Defluviitaleaceae bacterium]